MKKFITFLLTVQISALCCGCTNNVQIEDRNYVMAMGIDYNTSDAAYTVSLSFPDLKALTGDGMDLHYPVMEIQGRNLKEIEDIYHRESNKRLDFGQLQTIVLGKSILENEAALEVILSYMKNHQTFTRTILVCGSQDEAVDIIALDTSVNGSIGLYIRDMFENNHTLYGYEKNTLNDLIVAMANKNDDCLNKITMAVLGTDGEIPFISSVSEVAF